ncbi:MAG: amidase domain-containing protein [bacterium]|nr:amidase domain-containing protein [bacterium]
MPEIKEYNRIKAIEYANKWALSRNPNYLDFTNFGGDCTNYISQCLYAGSGVMNYTKIFGWYYNSAYDRTASWTGVKYLYNFLTTNKTKGPFATEIPLNQIKVGDLIQLKNAENVYYHTLIVSEIRGQTTPDFILINAHDFNALRRPLVTYNYASYRCLRIDGVYI